MTGRRVAYLLKMYPRFSETFVLNELLELERQGLAVSVFSLKRPDDGIAHSDVDLLGAPVTYLPESLVGLLRAQPAALRRAPARYLRLLAAIIRRRRYAALKHFLQAGAIAGRLEPAAVHVHAHFASGATSVALHLHQLLGLPYSFTAHAKDIYVDGVRPADLARKLRGARFAVTVSDFNARHLRELAEGTRVVRIYNGLDLERFSSNGSRPGEPPLVLAVGRLIEKKGFDDLVRACALLVGRREQFRCLIVGKGPLRDALAEQVEALGLHRCVELAGPVPRERLLGLYRQATVFVAPCVVASDGNRDGLPTVLVEAMALGVPVVATPVTGIPELVEDEATGMLVPERDPEALAAAIERVLADPALAERLARRARARVEERFDVRENVAQLRQLFEEVAA